MSELSHVYHRLRGRMILYAERRGCQDPEEVVDEALVRAFVDPGMGKREVPSLEAWAFGVLKKVLHESFRRAARTEQLTVDPTEYRPSVATQQWEDVRPTWEALPADDQELFESYTIDRVPSEKLAEARGLTPEGFRSRIHRIRKRLRRAVKGNLERSVRLETNSAVSS